MSRTLASAITRSASKQTYYTIRLLVDRPLVDDAYRAYAYFRWVDDVLDAEAASGSGWGEPDRSERQSFLDRQKSLMDQCIGGAAPRPGCAQEAMLVELIQNADPGDAGLDAYLRHMMAVMDFDVRRRGRLITQAELNDYTRDLAIAVSAAMHYFIGHGAATPDDDTRYLAVSGAHILHMLRDTYADVEAGYFNVPREVLDSYSIGPGAIHCDAYRRWVADRVQLARTYLEAGRAYFARVQNWRHQLAGLAYVARFEWLIEALERDGFTVRPHYDDALTVRTELRMAWLTMSRLASAQLATPSLLPVARRGRE